MHIDDLVGAHVSALIQYFDVDGKALMHEKSARGVVSKVDEQMGVVLSVDGSDELFKVPPLIQAFEYQIDGSYRVHWGVYRTQETRADGEHEWWDWKPLSI